MKLFIKITLFILVFNNLHIYGQRSKTEDNLSDSEIEQMAEEALQEEKYDKAVLLFKKLLDKKPDDSKLNFLVGFCYLNTDYGKEQSIEFFEDAIINRKGNSPENAPLETYYYLADAYYAEYNFDRAIEVLEEVSAQIPKNEDLFKFRVKSLKTKCKNGKTISQNKLEIKVENLFDINSTFSDHSPLMNNAETELIFTSRRGGSKMRIKNTDGQFDENIYTSLNIDSAWQTPYSLGSTVNSTGHESATYISPDFNTMIVRKTDREKGSLYITKRKDTGDWGKLVSLGGNVNTRYSETSASLSPNGQKLYFTSDRKGGFGGLDIYMSKKLKNGSWGPAMNLGSKINSAADEEMPFVHANGTLFFSSQGHNAMGGFDIFASSRVHKEWSSPVNMGMPINSVEDDFFYIPSPDGSFAYFSSKRQGGKGQSDIYRLELKDDTRKNYVLISGHIKTTDNKLEQGALKLEINTTDRKKLKTYIPNIKSKEFSFMLRAGQTYLLIVKYKDIVSYEITLNTSNQGSFLSLEQHILIDALTISASKSGTKIIKLSYTSKPKSKNLYNNQVMLQNSDSTSNSNGNLGTSGAIYSIQLLSSKTIVPLSTFGQLQDVKKYRKEDGLYVYYIGEYTYEWEATIKLRMIKEDYPQAFVFINTFGKKD